MQTSEEMGQGRARAEDEDVARAVHVSQLHLSDSDACDDAEHDAEEA